MSGVDGDFDVSNVNGKVRARPASRGSGSATTVNGGIDASFTAAPRDESLFKTVNGTIAVTFPRDLAADLRLKTFNGGSVHRLRHDGAAGRAEPARTVGPAAGTSTGSDGFTKVRVGAGGPALTFDTLNGDVRILRAAALTGENDEGVHPCDRVRRGRGAGRRRLRDDGVGAAEPDAQIVPFSDPSRPGKVEVELLLGRHHGARREPARRGDRDAAAAREAVAAERAGASGAAPAAAGGWLRGQRGAERDQDRGLRRSAAAARSSCGCRCAPTSSSAASTTAPSRWRTSKARSRSRTSTARWC